MDERMQDAPPGAEPTDSKGRAFSKTGNLAWQRIRSKQLEKEIEAFRGVINAEVEGGRVPTVAQIALAMRNLGFINITKRSISRLQKASGISLTLLRVMKGGQPVTKLEEMNLPPEGPSTWLKWHPLQLFDKLMAIFHLGEESDVSEAFDEPEEEKERRSTWVSWRVFLAAAFGLPPEWLDRDWSKDNAEPIPSYPGVPDGTEVPRGAAALRKGQSWQEIFEACTGRLKWPDWQARILALIVGRRGGKSYVTAIIGIYLACCRKYKLNVGTKGMVMILARDRDQAGTIRNYVLAFLKSLPELRRLLKGEPTQKLIELTNGITIEIRAVSDASTRGYTVVAVLADEIAFWPTDPNSARQDKKVLRALRPAMWGIKNSMIVMLSSPYAQRGELYEAYRSAYGKDDQRRYFVWQADTLSMRPTDDPDLIDEIVAEYEEDPDSAKAEYGAQFRSDLESIFHRKVIEGLSENGCIERGYLNSRAYRAFVDPSGGTADSYAVAIAHDEEITISETEKLWIPVLDYVQEWPSPFNTETVSLEVIKLLQRYHIGVVTGDAYGGEWPRDPLSKAGIGYVLSDRTRSELYLDFMPVVNSKRCKLLDARHYRKFVNQLCNLERSVGRSGRDSVDHPRGGHDDVANAVAGVMVTRGLQPVTFNNPDFGVRKEMSPAQWRFNS